MIRKFMYTLALIATILILQNRIHAKQYSFKINENEIKVDFGRLSEFQSYFKENYPDFKIIDLNEDTGLVKIEKLIEIKVQDGKLLKTLKVPDKNVGEILKFLKIKLREKDIVVPELDKKPQDSKITILRVDEKFVEKEKIKEFETIKQDSTDPSQTEEIVVREGANGVKKVTIKEVYVNGDLKSSVVSKEEVLSEPIQKIVKVPMNGHEKITRSATRSVIMTATAYEAGPLSTGKRPGDRGYGITASGTKARRGTVAVDPRVIPLGTKLFIKSLDPGIPDYGYATAEDTGGAIKGNKIDLFMNTVWECFQFGRRKVQVFILP